MRLVEFLLQVAKMATVINELIDLESALLDNSDLVIIDEAVTDSGQDEYFHFKAVRK